MSTLRISLIICTYRRPKSILSLLESIKGQSLLPDELLIIDASEDNQTRIAIQQTELVGLRYIQVGINHRGLTKQRNFGLAHINQSHDIVAFVDDDVILAKDYFHELNKGFLERKEIIGFGGIATNENKWHKVESKIFRTDKHEIIIDGHVYRLSLRNRVRNILGLLSHLPPGRMPNYSHGKTCGFPLTGKIYPVDLLVGMSMAFRFKAIEEIKFSNYFDGYGLYEDADFSIRAGHIGPLAINTKVLLEHHHAAGGRPNTFKYGKMVVRNGHYVWRVKNPRPRAVDRFKWHAITLLLISIRALNIMTGPKRKQAFFETVGRKWGWLSLWFNAPSQIQ